MTVKLHAVTRYLLTLLPVLFLTGCCSFIPDKRSRDVVHNPFPQLKRVAVLPFFNQSSEPTVDTEQVAEKYYAALQSVPGFEVLPVGVSREAWMRYATANGEPRTGAEFQKLANELGVEAIVVGSVTDFDPYYPPRMSMTVHWYAANEGFHPIPAGYGLPWGTEGEKQIPRRIVREAEFELARSQLATQTPVIEDMSAVPPPQAMRGDVRPIAAIQEIPTPPADEPVPAPASDGTALAEMLPPNSVPALPEMPPADQFHNAAVPQPGNPMWSGEMPPGEYADMMGPPMPANWPDATDFIPDPPVPVAPVAIANSKPVLSHTKMYRGDDAYFTNRLADYVETGDDARPGGWQDYLKRSDDFIHFCCHLHITEMLESRGGRDKSELILRWPLSRY